MKTVFQLFFTIAIVATAAGQEPATNRAWRYTLLEGSSLTEDCPICGRPTIARPLRGTFDLLLSTPGPIVSTYRMTNINFRTSTNESLSYTVTGTGEYRQGGEVVIQQSMVLNTVVCSSTPACRDVTFTNQDVPAISWPLIRMSVTQTQLNFTSVYTMEIVAAPLEEIWFVVPNGLTPTNGAAPIAAGSLLASSGHMVRTRDQFLLDLGIANPATEGPIADAIDIVPGGTVAFSLNQSVTSPQFGLVREGDLVSSRGIMRSNQQLLSAFNIPSPPQEAGLDAVFTKANGEILFSIRSNIAATAKSPALNRGDLLSSAGQVVKRNQELLARFHPANSNLDYGLDAIHAWPSGEIWFSTESGFQDLVFGEISDGDLLSSEGVIVYRNAELLSAFAAPPGGGLSDIFVVTDVAAVDAPIFVSLQRSNSIHLQWEGTNRVYQVERAGLVTGPWTPASFIQVPRSFTGTMSATQEFYRVRGW